MSLNWELGKIKDWETVCRDSEGRVHPVTNALIWRLMVIGIGRITEDNAVEVYTRSRFYTGLGEHPIVRWDEKTKKHRPDDFTVEEILRHVGLWTNVTTETSARWYKRITDSYVREEAARFRQEATKLSPALTPA